MPQPMPELSNGPYIKEASCEHHWGKKKYAELYCVFFAASIAESRLYSLQYMSKNITAATKQSQPSLCQLLALEHETYG